MRVEKYLRASPLFAIYGVYIAVLEDFQTRLKAEGLHFIQALVLAGIYFEERPVRPSELAATLGVSRSNMSHAIRGLEKAGLIKRSSDHRDARSFLLELTPAARRKLPRVIKLFDAAQNHFESDLGTRRINAWNVALKRLRESYSRVSFGGRLP
jgi:DNA-binding MarR family transcriptional regulator